MRDPEGRPTVEGDDVVSVLTIEDHPDWATLVERVLNTQVGEWFAQCVGSLGEGLQRLSERNWDLVMLDLNRTIESTTTVACNEWNYVAELDLDPALPLVPCFPGEFNQVVPNLIVTATHTVDEARKGNDTTPLGVSGSEHAAQIPAPRSGYRTRAREFPRPSVAESSIPSSPPSPSGEARGKGCPSPTASSWISTTVGYPWRVMSATEAPSSSNCP